MNVFSSTRDERRRRDRRCVFPDPALPTMSVPQLSPVRTERWSLPRVSLPGVTRPGVTRPSVTQPPGGDACPVPAEASGSRRDRGSGGNGDEVVQMTRSELIQLISDAIREVGGS